MMPAISIAYEKRESKIMKQPPRDAKKDSLVDGPMLFYTYLCYGILMASVIINTTKTITTVIIIR